MRKSDLTKKIGQCLGILALSTFIGSGVCYAKETNPKGYEIPILSEENFTSFSYEDLTDKIEGKETRIDNYYTKYKIDSKGNLEFINIIKASVDGKVFMYGVEKGGHGEGNSDYYAIFDEDGDGVFETKYTEEEVIKKNNEGTILPEWVLK